MGRGATTEGIKKARGTSSGPLGMPRANVNSDPFLPQFRNENTFPGGIYCSWLLLTRFQTFIKMPLLTSFKVSKLFVMWQILVLFAISKTLFCFKVYKINPIEVSCVHV